MSVLGSASNPFVKDPAAVKDFVINWAGWFAGPNLGDTIQTSTWIVPSGLVNEQESNTTTTATVWLSGGTVGVQYRVTSRITTVQGRTEDRSFYVFVTEQ